MALREDLEKAVAKILRERWTERDGKVVPQPEDLGLGNDAVKLDATILYSDMTDSTVLVDSKNASFAAEIYKSYLSCAAKIIKADGGAITAYDGDRIMAVFIGDRKNTTAAKCALKINHAVTKIINPAIKNQYSNSSYELAHVVGIDTSSVFVARIGVRNDNDLVWVGRAANYAAKLSSIHDRNCVYVTEDVFSRLLDEAKYGGNPKRIMWEARTWTAMGNRRIYRSNWIWSIWRSVACAFDTQHNSRLRGMPPGRRVSIALLPNTR